MTHRYAISLWQPWASLIFARDEERVPVKVHETRHWVPAAHGVIQRGQRLIIHAAKTQQGYRDISEDLHDVCSTAFPYACAYRGFLPHGAAIGEVTLADWYAADPARAEHEEDRIAGAWGEGRFAWRLSAPVLYDAPVPMAGRQGFWRVG